MSYDPYAPREAEEPPSYSPIKHPATLRDILRKLWAPIAGARLPVLEAQVPAARDLQVQALHGRRLDARLDRRVRALLGLAVRDRLRAAPARPRAGPRPRGEAGRAAGLGADVHPVPRRGDHAEGAARQRLERGEDRDRRPDRRRPRRRGGLGPRRVLRLRAARRARLHRLLPQPLQPRPDLAARRRPDRRGDPPRALDRRAPRPARADDRGAEPDPDPDPRPRRPRVVAAVAAPGQPRGRGVLPRHARAALDHRDLVHRPGRRCSRSG